MLDPNTLLGLPKVGAAPNAGAPPKLGVAPNAGVGDPPNTGAEPNAGLGKLVGDPKPVWATPVPPLKGPGWANELLPKELCPKVDCCPNVGEDPKLEAPKPPCVLEPNMFPEEDAGLPNMLEEPPPNAGFCSVGLLKGFAAVVCPKVGLLPNPLLVVEGLPTFKFPKPKAPVLVALLAVPAKLNEEAAEEAGAPKMFVEVLDANVAGVAPKILVDVVGVPNTDDVALPKDAGCPKTEEAVDGVALNPVGLPKPLPKVLAVVFGAPNTEDVCPNGDDSVDAELKAEPKGD